MGQKKRSWLEKLRKIKGFSQEEIANLVHIDRSYYSKIESGVRIPNATLAEDLADLLNFHVSIFELEEGPFYFALQDAPMIVAHFNLNLEYTWIFNPHPDFDAVSVIGMNDVELDDNPGTRQLMELKREVIAECKPLRKTILFSMSDGLYHYDVSCHPLFNEKGELIGGSSASTELSKVEKIEPFDREHSSENLTLIKE
ncbi:helix-turn-helix domain-containing protein [Bacillus sp. Marseille-Q1617]|uniref:helix-turn-helix domain-containing protein n=1 Tax=Bacillus sp. Marseille-Q1617 TaxID=2736887 RepID=UPI0015899813|nr:helix-turn-helix domain-containing protein [Bacillus sp. Marseille-Q1617]